MVVDRGAERWHLFLQTQRQGGNISALITIMGVLPNLQKHNSTDIQTERLACSPHKHSGTTHTTPTNAFIRHVAIRCYTEVMRQQP